MAIVFVWIAETVLTPSLSTLHSFALPEVQPIFRNQRDLKKSRSPDSSMSVYNEDRWRSMGLRQERGSEEETGRSDVGSEGTQHTGDVCSGEEDEQRVNRQLWMDVGCTWELEVDTVYRFW